jgi:hypothetical protein
MADYYPVLKRAISSLPAGSGEARRAVYERARSALLRQLNTYDPPLSPAEVTDQRLALEECIRRVESEVADAGLLPAADAPGMPGARLSDPGSRHVEPPREHARDFSTRGALRPSEPPAPEHLRSEPARPEPHPAQPEASSARPALVEERVQPRIGAGVSALSQTLRQAGNLGEASSTAVRQARQAIEEESSVLAPPLRVEQDPAEPRLPRGNRSAERAEAVAAPEPPMPDVAPAEPAVDAFREREALPSLQWPTEEERTHRRIRLIAGAGIAVLIAGVALGAFLMRSEISSLIAGPETSDTAAASPSAGDGLEPKILDRLPLEGDQPPVAPDAHEVTTEQVAPPSVDPDLPPQPLTGMADAGAAATPPAVTSPAAPEAPPATVDTAAPPASTSVSPPAAGAAPAAQQGIQVAQRAILYEEPVPGSPGTKLEGRVLWSFVTEPPLPGEKAVPQIRGVIEVPDNKLELKLSIHKNSDDALPASHIVVLNFTIPADFPGRTIDMTPGLIAKQTEEARGDPIIGAVAKVSDNIYWLALSGLQQDVDRNMTLLKSREWIDIPIRYGNRRRAILTFEKGVQGDKVFGEALAAWGTP